MIDWLEQGYFPEFPSTQLAQNEPNGLLAAGGYTTPLWLDQAYRQGIFPWNDPSSERYWWSPAPRAVILAEHFRISRTVKKLLKKEHIITANLAFEAVMRACAQPRNGFSATWISEEMIQHYTQLHHAGRALSVEYWSATGELIGGFYGVLIGQVFYGESMFSQQDNASKLAFATAAPKLFELGIQLIDCQMNTAHLAQFGLIELSRNDFEQRLKHAIHVSLAANLPSRLS